MDNKGSKNIIFVDFPVIKFRAVIDMLKRNSIHGEAVSDVERLLSIISLESYDACVINLLLGRMSPFKLIKSILNKSTNRNIKIIVVSRQVHKLNIQNSIGAGAHDFIADPFDNEDVYNRILYHLTPKRILPTEGYEKKELTPGNLSAVNVMLDSVEILSRGTKNQEHETFYKVLQSVATFLGSNRTSLVVVDPEKSTGVVLASSDDPKFFDFQIDLNKYPEILHVLNTGDFVLIDDVSSSTLTKKINEQVKSIQIGSVMVFPVRFQNEVTGVMTVRREQASELPALQVLRTLQAIANTLAAHTNVQAALRRIYKDYVVKVAG